MVILREFARYFAVGLSPKGAAKILAWEAVIVALHPILLTIVVNIPLMAVIGFVALAYYLGGKKFCNMNLVEIIKDDTLML